MIAHEVSMQAHKSLAVTIRAEQSASMASTRCQQRTHPLRLQLEGEPVIRLFPVPICMPRTIAPTPYMSCMAVTEQACSMLDRWHNIGVPDASKCCKASP